MSSGPVDHWVTIQQQEDISCVKEKYRLWTYKVNY